MKVSFLLENINKKLPLVNHAVSNRNQLPVLLNFLLSAKKGRFFISATDLDIGISVDIPSKIDEEGQTTVPAKTFFDLLGNLTSGKATVYTKDKTLVFETEKTKTIFPTIEALEFPKLYEEKGEKKAVIKKEAIEKDLQKVVFAASQDSGRPALSGVLFKREEKNKNVLFVATDGYRLSLKKQNVDGKNEAKKENFSILIPGRLIKEAISLKNNADVEFYISDRNNQVIFFQEETVLVGRLIGAEFPDYEKIIPNDFSTRVSFEKEELRKAVKTCSVFARETANIVKLSFARNKIIVSANTPSVGESTVEVLAKTEGEENEIAFNARYLLELFSNIDEEAMVFEMAGPLNPGVFKITGDDSFLHLIMPIRVQG